MKRVEVEMTITADVIMDPVLQQEEDDSQRHLQDVVPLNVMWHQEEYRSTF